MNETVQNTEARLQGRDAACAAVFADVWPIGMAGRLELPCRDAEYYALPFDDDTNSLSVFDRVGALDKVDDDEALLRVVMKYFTSELNGQMEPLREAIASSNTTQVRAQCHHLSQVADAAGAPMLGDLARRMGLAAQHGFWVAARRNLNELRWGYQLYLAESAEASPAVQTVEFSRGAEGVERM